MKRLKYCENAMYNCSYTAACEVGSVDDVSGDIEGMLMDMLLYYVMSMVYAHAKIITLQKIGQRALAEQEARS